jgi:hypothetical protein
MTRKGWRDSAARRRRLGALLAGALSGATAGCATDLEAPGTCERAYTCGPPCSLHPELGPAEDRCGIFVAKNGEDKDAGTAEAPVKTFVRAFALAEKGPMRVYACGEEFPDAIQVPAGVDVWGGLDCLGKPRTWTYHPTWHTTLKPPADVLPIDVAGESNPKGASLLLNLHGIATATEGTGRSTLAMRVGYEAAVRLEHFLLEAGAGAAPGGSAIALLVQQRARVELFDVKLFAGEGANGEESARAIGVYAAAGLDGNRGLDACTGDTVAGGESVESWCGEARSFGGVGGEGLSSSGAAGRPGGEPPATHEEDYGTGGSGQDIDRPSCTDGGRGAPGVDGAYGVGARGPGAFTAEGWVGVRGTSGGEGLPGQGGGGGGGSRGGLFDCGERLRGGASGGSGGTGGCGGKGGQGGGSGGASLGLVAYRADVIWEDGEIETRAGGRGGIGGAAQYGGLGGHGGPGGLRVNGSAPGCDGGPGGYGGDGGPGGGGLGGPSIGIVSLGEHTLQRTMVTFEVGPAGQGGIGGNPHMPGLAGDDGLRQEILQLQ